MQLLAKIHVPEKRGVDRFNESEFVDPVVPAPGLNQVRPPFQLPVSRVAVRLETEEGWIFISKGEDERSCRRSREI
jgi:hypothetical protein